MYLISAAIIIMAALFIKGQTDIKKEKDYIHNSIKNMYGQKPSRQKLRENEYAALMEYVEYSDDKNRVLDEVTASDFDIKGIFADIDITKTSHGQRYLFNMLMKPLKEEDELVKRDRLFEAMTDGDHFSEYAENIIYYLSLMGKDRSMPPFKAVSELKKTGRINIFSDYICLMLGIISTVSVFAFPTAGFFIIIAVLFLNLILYFKKKAKYGRYMNCFKGILKVISISRLIGTIIVNNDELNSVILRIKELADKLYILNKNAWLITSGSDMRGSLLDIVLDYLRMFLHLDILKFISMRKMVLEMEHEINELTRLLGSLDASVSVASYRKRLEYYAKPEFIMDSDTAVISIEDAFHPLLENPVSNSINAARGVIITGSNASGKSTFLRTAGICALLSQTIYTVPAKAYKGSFFDIYSSMSLSDSLIKGESYYMAEIKSLKRIIDAVKPDTKILCFVDEVLRGTNTAERISAGAEILLALGRPDVLCMAATHDAELTVILNENYDNYHFYEEYDAAANKISFPYRLQNGRSRTRNAIRLLSAMGFSEEIVNNAMNRCETFLENGVWI